ncbi:HepT-like ribonuclease domain-containing protein [Arsenicibacter rosenii]|uniref:DUF86 domain-containing protein n=1 Tax=Arsenicibacter rosenii TaxID=1750698 RepID=A0A1S2VGI0_9BACT|nr:DUF86 domain-containing protein [Arsenicibacter rosenii]OIN56998.1 DUF86 domain-containing protein [Arsenicibacter rosenii]
MKGRIGDPQRLGHILDAITELESYTNQQEFSDFCASSMMRYACIKQLEIIGEACNCLTSHLRDEYTNVEWRKVIGLRHLLVHEYFGVDAALIWSILQTDLPVLKEQILDIAQDIESRL